MEYSFVTCFFKGLKIASEPLRNSSLKSPNKIITFGRVKIFEFFSFTLLRKNTPQKLFLFQTLKNTSKKMGWMIQGFMV
jgi:hypothetical protein